MGNMGMVGSLVGSFGAARGAGAQIFYLLDSVPTINPLANRGTKPSVAEGNIDLKNVVFHYPSRPNVPVSSWRKLLHYTVRLRIQSIRDVRGKIYGV